MYMKNIYNVAPRKRSFRRLVRQWFSSLLKRQNGDYQKEFEEVMENLQYIEGLIEIIAGQVARWAEAKPGK